jgi:hypothetical protein
MTACDVILWAGRERVDLCVQAGRLVIESPSGPPAADLYAAIKAHKVGILHALTVWPEIVTFQQLYRDRYRPDSLADSERIEAERLAGELVETGGLGQHVICLLGRWPDLVEPDRIAVCHAWRLAVVPDTLERVA